MTEGQNFNNKSLSTRGQQRGNGSKLQEAKIALSQICTRAKNEGTKLHEGTICTKTILRQWSILHALNILYESTKIKKIKILKDKRKKIINLIKKKLLIEGYDSRSKNKKLTYKSSNKKQKINKIVV